MRKAVKLAAMSTLAAVAMVGGSAAVASADGGHKGADAICGNEATGPLVETGPLTDDTDIDVDDVYDRDQSLCQTGDNNFGVNYYNGNEETEEGGIIAPIVTPLISAVADVNA
jgi:hypothetical protein